MALIPEGHLSFVPPPCRAPTGNALLLTDCIPSGDAATLFITFPLHRQTKQYPLMAHDCSKE
ncbi:hypothetical protein DVU_1689 [Nitratidesulfovibrio vulgaris str. Hildenborough]|uniref:Uncharacterized protein n=1 Tax=Nitratidesulfovibrio vulgaris (strain ATCC 29579 / DSM 644 / CCUG 34227 / NCIMB 8303 / VKM B-1760 / Hildenborough) TaxID=882 RepID=Q72BE7_NITV2|nr:hypothetical protein DVU_1689 [Nitratidesulfovibrio vulgaris str. Hildenborough]